MRRSSCQVLEQLPASLTTSPPSTFEERVLRFSPRRSAIGVPKRHRAGHRDGQESALGKTAMQVLQVDRHELRRWELSRQVIITRS